MHACIPTRIKAQAWLARCHVSHLHAFFTHAFSPSARALLTPKTNNRPPPPASPTKQVLVRHWDMHKAQGAVPRFDLFDPATTRAVGTHAVAKKRRRGQELAGGGADEDDEAEVSCCSGVSLFFCFCSCFCLRMVSCHPQTLASVSGWCRMRTDPPSYT